MTIAKSRTVSAYKYQRTLLKAYIGFTEQSIIGKNCTINGNSYKNLVKINQQHKEQKIMRFYDLKMFENREKWPEKIKSTEITASRLNPLRQNLFTVNGLKYTVFI